jgi:hypothetical protein
VTATGEQLVRGGDDGPDDALARVVLVAAWAARGGEDEVVRPRGRRGVPVAGELVAQRGQDVDEPDAGLGLGVADGDPAVGEVDVAPAQRCGLADPQAGVMSVAISARRPAVRASGLASSSVAASIIATICSADSRNTGRRRVVLSFRFRVLTRTGLRATRSRSSATARIWPSRVIVLLIDSAPSTPSRTLKSR